MADTLDGGRQSETVHEIYFQINECDDIRFNQGAMFYRGIDQNGMCFFSQEDDPVQSEPSLSLLSKPKESIETQDDGPVSNRKFLTFSF